MLSGLTGEENFEQSRAGRGAVGAGRVRPRKAVPAQGLTPMLCALEGAALTDPERLYELKLDGVRIVADKRGAQVALRYRNGRSATASYAEIARAVSLLPIETRCSTAKSSRSTRRASPASSGWPRASTRSARSTSSRRAPTCRSFTWCSISGDGGSGFDGVAAAREKAHFGELVRGRGLVRVLDHIEATAPRCTISAGANGSKGSSRKRSSRRTAWARGARPIGSRLKCERDDDFVVLGYVAGSGSRRSLGRCAWVRTCKASCSTVVASVVGSRTQRFGCC